MSENILEIRDLAVEFLSGEQRQRVVEGVSFDIRQGETLALVGESGSGKSVTAHSILRLLPYSVASHPAGSIHYQGEDLLKLPERRLRGIRGNRIAMVFQEPMTSLNPLHTIEKQPPRSSPCTRAWAAPRPAREFSNCSSWSASPSRPSA